MPQLPNFVFVIGEDTGRTLACYGDPTSVAHGTTPNLDRLAARGCRFDQAWTTCPVCAPARASLVTGQYPTKIGTHQMRSRLLRPPRLFTQELRDAGYHVRWPTKLDFNFDPADCPDGPWRDDETDWLDRLRNGAVSDKPWLVYTNIAFTHESGMWPEGTNRPGRFGGNPRPPQTHRPQDVSVPPYLPDTPLVREDIARHYDNLRALDEQVGQILEALDTSGQADRTYIVFLADHGRGLAREKRWCYPAGLHMPLLIAGPGITPGTSSDRLVSWVDIAPTFLSLAGVAAPADYDGSAFLGDLQRPPREIAFAGRDRMDEAFDRVRVATDGKYLFVHNFFPQIPYAQGNQYMETMPTTQELRRLHAVGELKGDAAIWMQYPKPKIELYDLSADPFAVRNRAGDPGLAQVQGRLSAALEEWITETDDKGAYPEQELVDRGLVENRLDEYRTRIAPLPPEYRIGGYETVVDASEVPARP